MANNYYTRAYDFTPFTKVRSSEIDAEFDALLAGFDLLPEPKSSGTLGFNEAIDVNGVITADPAVADTDVLIQSQLKTLGYNMSMNSLYKITDMIDPTAAQDAATKAYVDNAVVAGGDPGDLAVTSLGIGTATADEYLQINSAGTAIVGGALKRLSAKTFFMGNF